MAKIVTGFATTAAIIILALACLTRVENTSDLSHAPQRTPSPPLATPTIGVLAQETFGMYQELGNQYVFASYVKYLEMAGARVVIIKGYQSDSYYQDLFQNKLNGLLLPGGKVDIVTSESTRVATMFYKMAIQAYEEHGDYFPIWGTCQGFEQLTVLTSGKNVLTLTDSEDLALPLHLTADWKSSRLLGEAPHDVIEYLQNENVTGNYHDWSLLVDTFHETETLHSFYNVISTNWDRNHKHLFVSTFESIKYPFYGVQWHPEMNIFSWSPGLSVQHTSHAVRVSQYFANFLVNEARKSSHRNASYEEIAAIMAENDKAFFIQSNMRHIYAYNVSKQNDHH